ncbi:MAG: site-2 protease family protein [Planctomycetota bacterium]
MLLTIFERQDTVLLTAQFIVLLFSLSFHEAAHAWMAFRRGDDTAALMGRLTLNPIAHMDPFLSVILPLACYLSGAPIIGGGKPVPVNPFRMKNPARDSMLVALAGPVSNVLLAIGFTALIQIGFRVGLMRGDARLYQVLTHAVLINFFLAFFNMLPVPPLDGSRVLGYFLPRPAQAWLFQLDRYGFLVLILVFYSGILGPVYQVFFHFLDAYSSLLIPGGA